MVQGHSPDYGSGLGVSSALKFAFRVMLYLSDRW